MLESSQVKSNLLRQKHKHVHRLHAEAVKITLVYEKSMQQLSQR